jgi:hypothetical protein
MYLEHAGSLLIPKSRWHCVCRGVCCMSCPPRPALQRWCLKAVLMRCDQIWRKQGFPPTVWLYTSGCTVHARQDGFNAATHAWRRLGSECRESKVRSHPSPNDSPAISECQVKLARRPKLTRFSPQTKFSRPAL